MHDRRLLPEAKVRERYGVSSMTLYRWDRNPSLNFPPPLRINNRKYRDASELDAFDEARLRAGPGSS
jgi:predicted DNA-binding transcriptional regulator AlpA